MTGAIIITIVGVVGVGGVLDAQLAKTSMGIITLSRIQAHDGFFIG